MSSDESEAPSKRFHEFDCPDCTANNPLDDSFAEGDEVQCSYCGMTFRVVHGDGGKFKLREMG